MSYPKGISQRCRRLPIFGRSPKFGSFQKIAQKIAQNFCAIFKIGQKRPKNLLNATKTLKKLPKIAHNFYPKKPPKSSRIFQSSTELFLFCRKYPKKLPKSSRILERFQSSNSSALSCLWKEMPVNRKHKQKNHLL